jgi:predicted ester cyclase
MIDARRVLQQTTAAWNRADLAGFAALAGPNVRIVASGGIDFRGANGLRRYFALWRTACPDHLVRYHNVVAEGSRAMGEGTLDGIHLGPLHHRAGEIPPTGRHLRLDFVGSLRTTHGKVSSLRIYFDVLDLMHQLGLIGRE